MKNITPHRSIGDIELLKSHRDSMLFMIAIGVPYFLEYVMQQDFGYYTVAIQGFAGFIIYANRFYNWARVDEDGTVYLFGKQLKNK